MLPKIRRTTLFSIFAVFVLTLAACAQAPAATTAPTIPPAATNVPTLPPLATTPPTQAPAATSAPAATMPPAATSAPTAALPATGATALPATGATATIPVSGNTVVVANNPTYGQILTGSNGMTLYEFMKDTQGVSNCNGACAGIWPPLTVPAGTTPTAGPNVTGTLGTIQRADGTTQVTINNMPLYFYTPDQKPGDALGQGVKGVWFVVGPDGNAIKTAAGTPSATSAAPGAVAGATPTVTSASGATVTLPTPTPNASASGKIALLLPENKTARYEAADRPYFTQEIKALCPNCQVIYSNANQDSSLQLSQAEAALTNGAQVLVLDPVDSAAAGVIADKAKAQGVPVIAYDRLILNSSGVNYYISFDNYKVGVLQAQALVNRLNQLGIQKPTIVMINGSPTDNNAAQFKAGAHSVFDPLVAAGKLVIAKEYDTPDWSPNQAQNEMQQALTALNNHVDGVYAANDGTAGGAIAAMKAAGINPLPPVTGQDAQLSGIQNILAGEQYMTIYKAIRPEANDAAILAMYLLTNSQPPAGTTNAQVNNNKIQVPSILLNPVVVTKDNIESTVVKDNFLTPQQICTSAYASACNAAGIK